MDIQNVVVAMMINSMKKYLRYYGGTRKDKHGEEL